MVLTDRQRNDLHAGIYEYLLSRPEFVPVAVLMRQVVPDLSRERYPNSTSTASTTTNNNTNKT